MAKTFTYTLTRSAQTNAGYVRLRPSGSLTAGDFTTTFIASLAAAVETGVTFDGVDKLTFTTGWDGALAIARTTTGTPATGATYAIQIFEASDSIAVLQATAAGVVGSPTLPTYPALLRGVNVSGMEFSGTPFYPSNAQFDRIKARGFNCVRLPGKWARMQPDPFGALDTNGSTGFADKYKAAAAYAASISLYVILDPAHDFGSRTISSATSTKAKVGDKLMPVSALDDFWSRVYAFLGGSAFYIYDLMNEPSTAVSWPVVAASSAATLRAAGCLSRLHISEFGPVETTANATLDPLSNFLVDCHQYLDAAQSGANGICSVGAGSRLDARVSVLNANSKQAFLGEFAGGSPSVSGQEQCATELPAIMAAAEASPFIGWTGWGGGEYWNGAYQFLQENAPDRSPTGYLDTLIARVA